LRIYTVSRYKGAVQPKPLSPQVFQILLSLTDEPRHGYAIIADVRERTGDAIQLTASTLYDALARLLEEDWLKEVDAPADAPDRDERRRYYQLTPAGRRALENETSRLEWMLSTARGKLQPTWRGRRGR
jgi:DNA-binding PadR family transcriptional regulator